MRYYRRFHFAVEVVIFLKLKSVLVDVDYDTFNIDIEKLKAAITPKNGDNSCSFVRAMCQYGSVLEVVEHNLCNLRQLSRNWSRLQIF
jgi:dTDP-4-amino-4,6-dideoxygalactose transaminase